MSYEKSLRRILEDRDPQLYSQLMKIEKSAKSLLSYTHGKFPYYTPHDFSHSLNVEENLNWLIPDPIKEQMNFHEIFFLLIAAWMHDWGLVGEPGEDPETIRENHHIRTERNFEEKYNKFGLSEHEGRIVGRICRGHRKEDLRLKDFEDYVLGSNVRIRRRFLAAILRIADECDITHNRTPEVIYHSLNPTDKAEEEFKKQKLLFSPKVSRNSLNDVRVIFVESDRALVLGAAEVGPEQSRRRTRTNRRRAYERFGPAKLVPR
ncbi:MAG: hypothetical protein ACE5I5_15710 [Candidatus Heimdallarchaeota archaeon]